MENRAQAVSPGGFKMFDFGTKVRMRVKEEREGGERERKGGRIALSMPLHSSIPSSIPLYLHLSFSVLSFSSLNVIVLRG